MSNLRTFTDHVLNMSRPVKRTVAVTADILLCLLAVALAFRLRLDAWIAPSGNQWLAYILAISLAIPIFIRLGMYRAIFRYVGWHAFGTVIVASAIYGALYSLVFTVFGVNLVPRSIGILQPILVLVFIGGSRGIVRFWLGGAYLTATKPNHGRRVLIYGAGSAGRQLMAGLTNSNEMRVMGFVDDDAKLHRSFLNGRPIYPASMLPNLIDELAITDVLLALPSASRQRKGQIVDKLNNHKVAVRVLPGIFELADGKVEFSDLRQIEIEDLLGRDPVPPDSGLMGKCITNRVVLVTGAGGSIGSELCRQILDFGPAKLVLVDHSEYNLYAIDQELQLQIQRHSPPVELIPVLSSVANDSQMRALFLEHRPQTVYHAAAYKHVPMVELNPLQGAANNIVGTANLVELASQFGVSDFVLISSDKAVRPPNIMGASKRIAEMLLQIEASNDSGARFSMVRFGNVLGSSGSVVPLFRKQIAAGGPVTITHPEVTRFFMTIPEAAQLVIQAGAMATGGEVFVLDMGAPVKIVELARRMIEISGLQVRTDDNPDGDIAIQFVGLRPAEKMYEELLTGDSPEPTFHPRILKAHDPCPDRIVLQRALEEIKKCIAAHDADNLRKVVAGLCPTIALEG